MDKSKKRKKAYRLNFVVVEDRGDEIARRLAKREMEKVFAKHGLVCENWNEVLSNNITGEMRSEHKER